MSKPKYLSSTASYPSKQYRDGQSTRWVRWVVVNRSRWTLAASDWFPVGMEDHIDRRIKLITEEQEKQGVGW